MIFVCKYSLQIVRFFLLGFMGVGKSTLGQRAAEQLVIPFVDLDEWIEDEDGRTITQIFQDDGESYFREQETECLKKVIHSYERFIMATGGGLPCHGKNLEIMKDSGITIYLRAAAHDLSTRLLQSSTKRPLLSNKSPLEQEAFVKRLLAERDPIYSRADQTLEIDLTRSKSENSRLLIDLLKKAP